MESNGEQVSVPVQPAHTDSHLDDDRPPQEGQFVGATLKIDGDLAKDEHEVKFADPHVPSTSGPGFDRNRPGSTIGRQSVRSTSSRTSLKPGAVITDKTSQKFFSYKESAFDRAVANCKAEHYKEEIDGRITGSWLLSQIDHWDNEREKVVMLTENSLLIYKYNFINNQVDDFSRVSLHIIDTIQIGDFQYPEWSVMPMVSSDREHGGVQIKWNHGELPSFGQRWNPWCGTIPWVTLCHHPIIYNPKEHETTIYNVDDFYESLVDAVSKAYKRKRPGEKVTVIEGQILIESWASLSSLVYNQSRIGFCKDRNGVAF